MTNVLYQKSYRPTAGWSQGPPHEFLHVALQARGQEPGPIQATTVRIKVGDSIPEALKDHEGRPVKMTCNGPEWVCEVW
jgi:hypothetical protein